MHGVITDRAGQVCEGAHVTLAQAGNAAEARTAISDNEGRYVFGDVPPGPFTLSVTAEGFKPMTVTAVLAPGQSYEAEPVMLVVTAEAEVEVIASRREIAVEQVREEEHQRVLGVIPNFFVSYAADAQPLTPRQKFHLAWRNESDPISVLSIMTTAATGQATNSPKEWGQGSAGFARRYGAAYGDDFLGTMLGSALLPSLFHQDPRYFYKGTGSKRSRILYAIRSSVICRSDAGRWQFNYSSLLGNFAGAGLSNLYYPAASRNGIGLTFQNILIAKATGAAQNIFQELYVRKLTSKGPGAGTP
ncbi:MAG: carboxypeptidase-like regulatory domain-containing protein [Terracidiphilus sp.]